MSPAGAIVLLGSLFGEQASTAEATEAGSVGYGSEAEAAHSRYQTVLMGCGAPSARLHPPRPGCSYTYPIYIGVLKRTLRPMRGIDAALPAGGDADADSIKPGSSTSDLSQLDELA